MNYFEMDDLFQRYTPPALYILTITEAKKNNPVYDTISGRVAYPLYLQDGERGYICYMADDNQFHRLHTSIVESATPSWESGEGDITIKTANATYRMRKLIQAIPDAKVQH